MEANRYQKNDRGIFGLEAGNIWNPFDSCFVFQHSFLVLRSTLKKEKSEAIEIGIILLIDQVAAAVFVK